MIQIPAEKAALILEELLEEVKKGRDVVIIGANGKAFKLELVTPISEKTAALIDETYREDRAERGDRGKFEAALAKIAGVDPSDERNKLQHTPTSW